VAPPVHRVFSNLKPWLHGTHYGGESWYLQRYVDELDLRSNRRNSPNGCSYQTLLGISTQNKYTTPQRFGYTESTVEAFSIEFLSGHHPINRVVPIY
jgi:hypothetical protein